MEVENQVSGKNAEAVENNYNLESEDFYFCNHNKKEAKDKLDRSSEELADFIDSLISEVPAPSEDEVNSGIEKILAETHPDNTVQLKADKKKKVTLRVLFVAAILSVLSFSCLFAVGNSHDVSIENGFVTFAKETIKIAFFGEEKEEYISVDALLADLDAHGYGDILFPQEFVTNSDEYKAVSPDYSDEMLNQVIFEIYNENYVYNFLIHEYDQTHKVVDYDHLRNTESFEINGIFIYLFEYDSGTTSIEYIQNGHRISIQSKASSEIAEIAKTLK